LEAGGRTLPSDNTGDKGHPGGEAHCSTGRVTDQSDSANEPTAVGSRTRRE